MRNTSVPAIALLITMLAATSADAQQPLGLSHVAEVQFDPGALTPLVNAAALNLRDGTEGLCTLPTIACPVSLNASLAGQTCVLDRVSFPGPVSLRRSPGTVHVSVGLNSFDTHPVQAVVPFNVRISRAACLTDPSLHCTFGQDDAHASLSAVFDVTPEVTDGNLQVCISYAATLLGPIDISSAVQATAIPRSCLPLNTVTALASQIQTEVQDVQLSASSDLKRLGVRIWFVVPQFEVDLIAQSEDTYNKFFDGLLAPAPANTQWSVFIGEQLLLRLARQNAFTQIQNAAISHGYGVFLDSSEHDPYYTAWVPGDQPTGLVQLYVRTDAMGCTAHFSISAVTSFRLDAAADTFTITGSFSYDASVEGCLAGMIPGSGELLEAYLDGQIPGGTVLALGGICEADLDEFTFECNLPTNMPVLVPFGGAPAVKVSIDKMIGDAAGLAAGGALGYVGGPADAAATATIGGFGYGWDGCSTKRAGWFGDLHLDGWGRLCSASILNDPQDVYLLKDADSHDATLPKEWVLENYMGASAPYPLQVQLRTTNGSGLLTLPVPEAISNLEIGKKYADMISECDAKLAGHIRGWFDPHWRVDPDPPVDRLGVLVDNNDRSIATNVQVQNVRFEAVGPVQRTTRGRGEFALHQQALRMSGRAWVKPKGLAGFHVPVKADVIGNFNGLDMSAPARLTQFTLANNVSRRVEVPASALPKGHKSLSFALQIPADDLTLTGFLPLDTLAGSWSFDEGRGSNTQDFSGQGNPGVISGTTPGWVSSGRNGALAFAPASGRLVEVANSRSVNPAAFSISAWFNSTTVGQNGFETILTKGSGSGREYGLGVLPNGRVQFIAGGVSLSGPSAVKAKSWHHVVATYDGAALRLYLDGRLEGTKLAAVRITDNGSSLTIGGERVAGTAPSNGFNGALDEVRLYSVALRPVQAASAYW